MEGVIAVTLVLKQNMIQFWFHYVIARGVVKCLEQLILEQCLENRKVIKGEAKEYTCSGGSGLPVHYFFCPDCGVKICGKYDAFEGFIIIPLGTFDDPHLFRPAAEIFTNYKLDWIKSSSVKESFEEAAVMERIQLLMENLDQREQ